MAKIQRDNNIQQSQAESLPYTKKNTKILGYMQKAVYCDTSYSDRKSCKRGMAE